MGTPRPFKDKELTSKLDQIVGKEDQLEVGNCN